jgi:multidrug efflux pump
MNAIIHAVVHRPRPVLLVLAILLIAGVSTYVSIPKEAEPDVAIPILYVNIAHDGISPEDAERLLVRPMEKELRTIEGLRELRATATEGSAVLILEFEAGFDANQALLDVREKVDTAKVELPADTDEPSVQEVNIALFPVLVVQLHGNVPERMLVSLARNLRDTLEGLPGVLQAEIAGDREELLEIVIDPVRLESYNLDYQDLLNFVARSNRLVAAGALDAGSGRFAVKVPGVFEGLESVLTLPIKTDGLRTVTFADIGAVRRTFKDPTGFARLDGQPAVALEISKRIGANVVEVVDAVRAAVAAEQAQWPENVQVTFTQDRSEDVRTMLGDLQNNVLTAILLVMIVVLGALGPRSAGLVGVAIPGSFLTAILVLAVAGLSINIVVLFALIMSVGMLVDGAIVVVEQADRHLGEGHARTQAYVMAAKRMAWPLTAATATTLSAFLPLLFWPGVVGEFMKYLPITLLATLAASLIMALLFVPTIGSLIGAQAGARHQPAGGASRPIIPTPADSAERLAELRGVTGGYVSALRAALAHSGKILMLAFALLAGVYAFYGAFGRGVEFFPDVEPTQANINIHARGDMSVIERDQLVGQVEQRLLDMPELESVYTRTGLRFGDEADEDIIGRIQLRFVDWEIRRPAAQILTEIRERTSDIAGIVIETQAQESGPTDGKPIQLELSSRLPELLSGAVAEVRAGMERIDGLVDITDSRPIPGIEWRIDIDRAQAARFGLDLTTVGNVIQLVTNGILIGEYRPFDADDEVDIRVRFPDSQRSLLQLDRLRATTPAGPVPIGNFMTRTAAPRVGDITRTNGRRVMTIHADVADGVLADDMVREIQRSLASANLDPAVDIVFKGEDQDQREAEEFLTTAFAVALFLMAIILVTQFNSFYQALLVLSAVVFSTVGVLLGLLVTDQPFGVVMTGVGVIALAGIVVNNNIVFIDTYNLMRREGVAVVDAVLLTSAERFRPVLLTTVTTILGLLPMALGVNFDLIGRHIQVGGPSTQWWTQLATAVAGGLAFATLLTLILTPCLLILGHRTSEAAGNLRTRLATRGRARDVEA